MAAWNLRDTCVNQEYNIYILYSACLIVRYSSTLINQSIIPDPDSINISCFRLSPSPVGNPPKFWTDLQIWCSSFPLSSVVLNECMQQIVWFVWIQSWQKLGGLKSKDLRWRRITITDDVATCEDWRFILSHNSSVVCVNDKVNPVGFAFVSDVLDGWHPALVLEETPPQAPLDPASPTNSQRQATQVLQLQLLCFYAGDEVDNFANPTRMKV